MAYQLNTCSPVTLSSLTSNLFTFPFVHSSTKHLFICYFVFSHKQLVHSSTCSLVYSPILSTFFQVLWEWEVAFWLLKDALLACKRCPLRTLLTPFWSLNKHLLLSCFIIIWFSASYKVTCNTCFSPLIQGFYWWECQGFWHE